MTTPYARGYAFELKVRSYLENLGYAVFRVGGSHSPADLIALGSGMTWLIQCQRSKYFSKDKKTALQDLAVSHSVGFVFAWNVDGRKRGNSGIAWSDVTIINSAPGNSRAEALRGK